MGRKKSNQDKRKKEEKRLEKLYGKKESDHSEAWFIIIGIVVVFVLFYLLTIYITNKNTAKKKADNQTNTTSVGETIVGSSFSMGNEPYFVLYYDSTNDEVATDCKNIFNNYRSANGEKSIYYVDMNSGFNKASVATGESNKNPQNASELAINGPTLIKIQEGKAVEYVEGVEAIQEYLK